MKNIDLSPLTAKLHDLWSGVNSLFGGHHLVTLVCGFLAIMMVLSLYRMLKSVSPALIAFASLLLMFIVTMHWTVTRTEPAVLKPAIDFIAPFFPTTPQYEQRQKEDPLKPKPVPAKPRAALAKS